MDQNLKLGAIGNCSVAALVGEDATVEWYCWPQYDADPVFSRLINGPREAGRPGYFGLQIEGMTVSLQKYVDRTPVLVTMQRNAKGDEIEIIDFCPMDAEGFATPANLEKVIVRLVRKVKGEPRIVATLRPTSGYGAEAPDGKRIADGVLEYKGNDTTVWLQTGAPLDAVTNASAFALDQPAFFVFGARSPIDSAAKAEAAMKKTVAFWNAWISTLTIPKDHADAFIRAAITLKLCTHRPTGGMVAAFTSSIPEYNNCKTHHWDYRYSWVRDNYFTLNALLAAGDADALRVYAPWLRKIMTYCREKDTHPAAFRIAGTHDAEESIIDTLTGYRGQGTVRVGNEAYKQQQNDFFASVILSLAPFFTDARFKSQECPVPVDWLENLAVLAYERYDTADSGLWEFRTQADIFTYSAINCWSAAHTMAKIFKALGDKERTELWTGKAKTMRDKIIAQAWHADVESFTNSFRGHNADASVFLISELEFLPPGDPMLAKTIKFLESKLRKGIYVFRHDHTADDASRCVTAFTSCTLWMLLAFIDAGRGAEAREVFDAFLKVRSPQGMYSEHVDSDTGELWANYPQTYAMAGVVTVALKLAGLLT